MKTIINVAAVVVISAITFIGCGETTEPTGYTYSQQAGIFVDSPVDGITFKTDSGDEGITVNGGIFRYDEGETVSFYIGSIYLGKLDKPVHVTPNDFPQTRAEKALQLRFIQALDQDSNLSNGIQLRSAAVHITGETVDWTDETSAINALRNISIDAGLGSNGLQLVDEAAAIQHFEDYNHVTLN